MLSHRLWTFERGVLWALEADNAAPAATPRAEVTFAEATAERASIEAALAQAMELAEPDEIRRRFEAGSRCFVALVAGEIGSEIGSEIAGYGWVSRGVERIGELERWFRMQPDEAYIWDCATLPPYRRRGVYAALLGHMASLMREDGVRRVWIGAARDNHPSLRGFARAGFQPVASVAYTRALWLRYFWLTPEPDAPPGLVAAARWALASGSSGSSGSSVAGTDARAETGGALVDAPGGSERLS